MGAQGLHAQQGKAIAFGEGFVGARSRAGLGIVAASLAIVPLVDLLVGLPGGARIRTLDGQVGLGAGVVVVAAGVLATGELVVRNEAADVLGIDLPAGCVVLDLLVRRAWHGQIGAHAVREHEAVLAVAVVKVIGDPSLLAQALEEREVALVELRLKVSNGVGLAQVLVDGKCIVGEQFVQDLNDGLVLIDPAVAGQRGQMQPGPQRELVLDMAAFFAPQLCIGDEGVDLPHTRAVEANQATDLPAYEAVEIDIRRSTKAEIERIGGLEQQFIFKQAVDALAPREPHGLQRIGNGRAGNGKGSRHWRDLG